MARGPYLRGGKVWLVTHVRESSPDYYARHTVKTYNLKPVISSLRELDRNVGMTKLPKRKVVMSFWLNKQENCFQLRSLLVKLSADGFFIGFDPVYLKVS